jgi:DNA-binding transcriptional MerR regulator
MGLFSDCQQMVKYSGTRIEIATVKGPVQIPVEVGGVKIKPQLLQTAGSILQILDWLQLTACKRIHALRKLKGISHEIIANLILKQDEDARLIAHITILSLISPNSAANFEKVLADWIAGAIHRVKEQPIAEMRQIEVAERLRSLERELADVDDKMADFEKQIENMRARKRTLEENMRIEKEVLCIQVSPPITPHGAKYRFRKFGIEGDLAMRIAEATSVFPYLSKALSNEKPFDVEKSLKLLTEDEK